MTPTLIGEQQQICSSNSQFPYYRISRAPRGLERASGQEMNVNFNMPDFKNLKSTLTRVVQVCK